MARFARSESPGLEASAGTSHHRGHRHHASADLTNAAPISVEVLGPESLFAVGTMPSRHVPQATTSEVNGVYVLVRYRAGRILSVVCQSVGEARKLPGFRPL